MTIIGLNFKTLTAASDVGGKLEKDFFGGSIRDQFCIRHAYLSFDKYLIRQTSPNFIAPEYDPEIILIRNFVQPRVMAI